VLKGQAEVAIGSERRQVGPGALVLVPARTLHHVRNSGPTPLFFLTLYAPPAY